MVSLQTADYVVIVVLLLVPLGIGVVFAVRDAHKVTRDEYLLGGRNMAMVPVMLSIFVTFQSAISLIGMPSEVYIYGPTVVVQDIGIMLAYFIGYFTVTPLLYPLRITSVFQYLEMRFESKTVRILSTVLGMLQVFFYLSVALLAPGLALEAAAGIPIWMSVVIVGVIGTFYTAIGGMKSVVWTDAFQTVVVFVGIFAVMAKSTMDAGGLTKSWSVTETGGRTNFNKFNPDPRIRHTWYGCLLIGITNWMSNLFSQSTCQRISSMKNLRSARRSMLLNAPLNLFYGFVCMAMGWCMYSYLAHIQCDPLEAGIVSNSNQITPYFVLHVMEDLPGFAGVYMSSLFSGALSTMSSGINALAANTVEDLLQKPLKKFTEKTVTTITKLVVFGYGAAIVMIVYLARNLKGQVTQMANSVFGCFGSSVLGMFLLGCTVPWGNKYGAISGALVSMTINIWLNLGNKLYGRSIPTLKPVSTDQCFSSNSSLLISHNSTFLFHGSNDSYSSNSIGEISSSSSIESTTAASRSAWGYIDAVPNSFSVYDISYEWYGVFGVVISYTVGVLVSRLTRHKTVNTPHPKLMIPFLRGVWGLSDAPDFELIQAQEGKTNGFIKEEVGDEEVRGLTGRKGSA